MIPRQMPKIAAAAVLLPLWLAGSSGPVARAAPADGAKRAFDAAPFGMPLLGDDNKGYGVRWAEPRKVRRLVLDFAEDATLPESDKVHVQYWQHSWNGGPDPIVSETAAGGEGWAAIDDWTNGTWMDAHVHVESQGKQWTFTFASTKDAEFKNQKSPGVTYRKTLKMRVFGKELPRPVRFAAYTDSIPQPLRVRILWGTPADAQISTDQDEGHLEAFNGDVTAVKALADTGIQVDDKKHWTLPGGKEAGIEADLLLAADPIDGRYDRTIVTVRSKNRPFSFAADEVARGDRILVDDFGALVTRADDPISLEAYRQARKEFPGRTIYDRVFSTREQTLSRAWDDMPIKRQLWFVHGLPGNRNAMRQDPNGDIGITAMKHWFKRPNLRSAKDSDRKGWDGDYLWVRFGFPGESLRAGRELRDGYLPVLRTWWVDGPIYYEQLAVLDKLDGDLKEVKLDDPTVLLMKLRVVNTSVSDPGTASLRFSASDDQPAKLTIDGDRGLADGKDGPRLRFLIRSGDRGKASADGDGVRWSLELKPGESHELLLAIPSITLNKPEEIESLRKRDFDADSARICAFWKKLVDQGAQIETPEPWLNDFYKANAMHLEINCLHDLKTPRRYAHVGTFAYGVYCNESVMMISDLDRRGYHETAEQCLQTWLDFQGSVMLPSNFKNKKGLFYGSAGSESGGYNKHHGYVMWCMAEHWRYTHDRKWMEQAAPHLVDACEFIIRERKATMTKNADGTRAFEYGWLPAGGLEDVQDYWYWLATNACSAWGFDAVAESLSEFGHPEAERLQKEAKAYHDDVVHGGVEARIRAPVVRLRDATYVPHYPPEVYTRGRSIGWIREVLEGPVVLLLTGLVAPDTPDAKWILKDYEDNLYVANGSNNYGYSIPTFDRFWFSRGGFCMQANLLDSPLPYLYRDEIQHYLRTYFNAFTSGFFPQIRMLNEHALPELGYPAGDHFKSSDEAQSTYWLRLMFVNERGNELYLGQAIPRYWLAEGRNVGIERAASHFGPLSLRISSQAGSKSEMKAIVTPPTRDKPKTIYVRLRHPESKPMKSVTVNGKPYDKFDPKKEWVVLPGDVEGVQEIVAHY